MTKVEVLALLHKHRPEIQRRFKVEHLALFGSVARDEMHEASDVDVLIKFQGLATFDGYMDLKAYLEALFKAQVDLVIEDDIKPRMRPIIEKDLIRVA